MWIEKDIVAMLPESLKKLYDDFCILKPGKYGAPASFNDMTSAWYLNHSKHPNMAADGDYRFYALRDIKSGEELTVDYDTYSGCP